MARDPLTGLSTYNRFFDRAQNALGQVQALASLIAIFSIDLNHFHYVNEDHGHDGGDAVLLSVADRLRTSLSQHETDTSTVSTICRVGGDEFLVLLEGVLSTAAAAALATVVLDAIAEPITLESGQAVITARVGVAMAERYSEAQQMILEAEMAQRHIRHVAGGRQHFYTAELREPREQLESDLAEAMRHALTADEFHIVYQPKISLTTNRIVGVEALLRWDHPALGLMMPSEFIPVAESSGVIVPVGEWVLRQAFRQAATWQAEHPQTPVHVAINVSARQFQSGLVPTIRGLLIETGIKANTICLEVTETTIMTDIEGTIRILDELKALGFKLSIDDFGTGYSSLEYLHRMPIDELKIDRSFVAGLGASTVSRAIVASIISLAQTMNQEVVAEGVETRDQLERIRTMGCDFAQGYHIALPVSATEIGVYLATHAAGQTLVGFDATGSEEKFTPWIAESVLIIDDATDVRMLARMCLTAAGFTVTEAVDGTSGLAMARQLAPDCIVLDVGLPDTNGMEVCRALREGLATKDCTIVMLTGHDGRVDKADAFLAGADDYIVKPFTPRDLATRVRSALDRRRRMIETMGRQVDTALLEMLRTVRDQDRDEEMVSDDDNLSSRQIEILRRMLSGQRVKDVAQELFLSQSTIRNHLSAIYQRFGVHSQTELLNLLRKRAAETAT